MLPQGTPITGTSTAEDIIVISDESAEWKDSSERTTKAAWVKKKAEQAAKKAAIYAQNVTDKAA